MGMNSGQNKVNNKVSITGLWKIMTVPLIVILVSCFIPITGASFGLNEYVATGLGFVFPMLLFIAFYYFASKCIQDLEKLGADGLTEAEINRVIEKYTGIVDGIGTAMPLIGAAILLYTIGHKFEDDNVRRLAFEGFAVPFEIKAILILAAAKLFESVFDDIALEFQTQSSVSENSVSTIVSMLDSLASLDKDAVVQLKEFLETTDKSTADPELIKSLNGCLDSLKDENVTQGVDRLARLAELLKSR